MKNYNNEIIKIITDDSITSLPIINDGVAKVLLLKQQTSKYHKNGCYIYTVSLHGGYSNICYTQTDELATNSNRNKRHNETTNTRNALFCSLIYYHDNIIYLLQSDNTPIGKDSVLFENDSLIPALQKMNYDIRNQNWCNLNVVNKIGDTIFDEITLPIIETLYNAYPKFSNYEHNSIFASVDFSNIHIPGKINVDSCKEVTPEIKCDNIYRLFSRCAVFTFLQSRFVNMIAYDNDEQLAADMCLDDVVNYGMYDRNFMTTLHNYLHDIENSTTISSNYSSYSAISGIQRIVAHLNNNIRNVIFGANIFEYDICDKYKFANFNEIIRMHAFIQNVISLNQTTYKIKIEINDIEFNKYFEYTNSDNKRDNQLLLLSKIYNYLSYKWHKTAQRPTDPTNWIFSTDLNELRRIFSDYYCHFVRGILNVSILDTKNKEILKY